MPSRLIERLAFLALLGGATGIGVAPIFVRVSEVGPSATAFYRLLFALPILWVWAGWEDRFQACPKSDTVTETQAARTSVLANKWQFALAGLCFAGDLALWHWSLKRTTVANSTLIINCAPCFMMLGARVLLKERISAGVLGGLLMAFTGGALLGGNSLQLTLDHVLGDALALAAAAFYAGYLLIVKHLRRTWPTSRTMFWTGMVACPALLAVTLASESRLWPASAAGWSVVIALAAVSHVGGQGLIAYALGHLPASFSAVSLLWQPVVAAALAWLILPEPMSALQMCGGAFVLAGMALANQGRG